MSANRFDLLLVRHGLTDWNEEGRLLGRSPVPLNERGLGQAQSVAEGLARLGLSAVIASPQRRTQETAEAIAREAGLTVETEPGLDEVWLGRWLGKKPSEIREDPDFVRFRTDATYACDAIEPAEAVGRRVVEVVERLRAQARERPVVVLVSHGDPLRLLVAHYLAMPISSYRRLRIDPASVSLLRFSPRGPALLALNWKAFDASLADFFVD